MGDNSSHDTGGNSTTNLFSDRVKVPRLQTKDSGADRLNGNQSLEPQLDNTKWRNNCLESCVLLSIEDEAASFIFLLWSFEFTLSYIIGENELV
jgi:hypothetical protein